VWQAKAQGTDSSTLEDQRTELTRQLSELIDVNVVQTEQGPTLNTASGIALVVGDKSFAMSVRDASDGAHVYLRGDDITPQIQGGHLGGVINVRDNFIPGITAALNQLASDFAAAFNKAHASSVSHLTYDLNGDPGEDFFSATTAGDFSVKISDPNKIAASSSAVANEAGSNGNVASLISAGDNLGSGASTYSAITFYSSNLVFAIGNETYQANSQDSTEELSLRQLQDQRNSTSGVSINEETANLLRYQHAYQAAARIVTTVDELTKTVLTMGAQ
jgi:flagellar hook-associated protein 1 FlgK